MKAAIKKYIFDTRKQKSKTKESLSLKLTSTLEDIDKKFGNDKKNEKQNEIYKNSLKPRIEENINAIKKQIDGIPLNQPPEQITNEAKLIYQTFLNNLDNIFKKIDPPLLSQGPAPQLPSKGRARLSKKEALKILKNKTPTSNSAITQLDTEILNILNS